MELIFTGNNNSATAPNNVKNILSLLFLFFQRIDYIYLTGDIIDHGVWNTSIQKNSDVITKVLQRLNTEFPDTSIYPILGNHEPSPLNV
jgi:predicted MPP superfamily phosphohydrolase